MEESKVHKFTYKEIAEALVKKQGLHEGLWGIYVEFGIAASNMGESPQDVLPAAIVPIVKIGIQKFKEENNLTVDAAIVNPA